MELFIKRSVLSRLGEVSDFLREQNVKAYLVGGFVRDVLLGRDTADIDIAVGGDALEIAPRLADALGGRYIPLDEENGVGRVVLAVDRRVLDFSTIAGSLEDDLGRRDFTIDAIAADLAQVAVSPADVELIDPYHGCDDLRQGVLRATTETSFEVDAARLLRAVRLAAELGFNINRETEALMRRSAHLIAGVAGERVREELLRVLAVPRAGHFWRYLDNLGLLCEVIPELAPAKGVAQPKEHCWDVFDHSLQTVAAAGFLLRQGEWEHAPREVLDFVPWSAEMAEYYKEEISHGSTRGSLLKLAALLHDVAKPGTRAVDGSGRVRFLGHAELGAQAVEAILERLRFSNREIRLVAAMVRHHMRPTQLSQEGLPTPRAIYRFFRDTGDAAIEVLYLSLADHLAARGASLDMDEWRRHAGQVGYVLTRRLEEAAIVSPPKLVSGHDLINIFAIKPGPAIGRLLEAAREAQAAGEIKTRDEALVYIRERLLVRGCQ